ncbi:MAG: 50S ribosome-binding GTPase [Zoogloeaceae bacterium]|nr:50S ribosome-binding GTPase [Zoogloeaceae bacterium]
MEQPRTQEQRVREYIKKFADEFSHEQRQSFIKWFASLYTDDAIAVAAQSAKQLTPEQLVREHEQQVQTIKEQISLLRNCTPKVGVFGNSGVGKSTLCNAIFGQDVAKVNDVEACTRKTQEILLQSETGGMILVDFPGIGEDPEHQKEYTDLYKSKASELDLILWAIKADDRDYYSALKSYEKVFSAKEKMPPVLFVITQADKTNDKEDWDGYEYKPGGSQIGNITIKEKDVSRRFDLKAGQIISIAISRNGRAYNLTELVVRVVKILTRQWVETNQYDIELVKHVVKVLNPREVCSMTTPMPENPPACSALKALYRQLCQYTAIREQGKQ